MIKIGSVWCKNSQETGKGYLSFSFEPEIQIIDLSKNNIVAFENENKKSNNSPDYFAFLDSKQNKKEEF